MPVFDTPEPISVAIELFAGAARISAGDRVHTVVHVRPTDEFHEPDRRDAEQTRVEYGSGRLLVRTPKPRHGGLFGRIGSVEVTVEVPAGSHVRGDGMAVAFRGTGEFGTCRVKTASGDLQFDLTGPLDLTTGYGTVLVEHVTGHAEINAGSGAVRVREIDGTGVIKNSNGDNWVGAANGDLRVNAANGDIVIDRAGAGLTANTAKGDVRIGTVCGSVSLNTGCGAIEIGIQPGTAARLDVYTDYGNVRNHLDTIDSPGRSDQTVEVHAHSGYGDIVIRRSRVQEGS